MPGIPSLPSRRLRSGAAWLALICALLPAEGPAAEEPIVEIRFLGNATTKEVILRQEMVVSEGDPADPKRIETSRQNIMNLGLFQSVKARTEPVDGGQRLEIEVKEKFYILPLPTLDRSAEGDITWGGELRFDNLLGYNQRLTLKNENTDKIDGGMERQSSIGYGIERIPGTRLGLRAGFGRTTEQEEIEAADGRSGEYKRETYNASVSLLRWLRKDAPSKGWRARGGLAWSDTAYEYVAGDPGLAEGGQDVRVNLGVEYTATEEYEYDRGGEEYGVDLTLSAPSLGAEQDYQVLRLYRVEYLRLPRPQYANLNYQLRFGYANNTGGGSDYFRLGGSSTLRGYDRDDVQGDAYALANVEYIAPVPGFRRFRGVAFTDVGNAYPEDAIDLLDLKAAVGLGLRWKIPFFVRVDLRVDVAYAVDAQQYKVYAGSSSTF